MPTFFVLQRVDFWCGIPTLLKGDKQMLCKNDELINEKKLRCIELKGEGLWQEVQCLYVKVILKMKNLYWRKPFLPSG